MVLHSEIKTSVGVGLITPVFSSSVCPDNTTCYGSLCKWGEKQCCVSCVIGSQRWWDSTSASLYNLYLFWFVMNTEWREGRERGEHLTSAPLSRGEELLSGLQRHQRVQTNTRSHTHLLKEILPSVDSPLGGSWSRKEKKKNKNKFNPLRFENPVKL